MRGKAKARWVDGAIRSMLRSNQEGADTVRAFGARACTDVTGFGLLGHLVEMSKASTVDVHLDLNSVPLLEGAHATAAAGLLSSLQPQNVRLRRAITNVDAVATDVRYLVLFDPQTAGGLLAGVPGSRSDSCVARLRKLGYSNAAVIGVVKPRSDRDEPIAITL